MLRQNIGKQKVILFLSCLLAGLLGLFGCYFMPLHSLGHVKKWAILLDYDDSQHTPSLVAAFADLDMVILDADSHPPLTVLSKHTLPIAYISLGEAETYRNYWRHIKNAPWVLFENPHWEGNYVVDIREEAWHNIILDQLIPPIIAQGFAGLFMDTLDTVDLLQYDFPGQYPGADTAMTALVKKIKNRYPKLHLISNNGFSILNAISPYLSGMLVEDIHMMANFENNTYKPVPEEDYNYKVAILKPLMKTHELPVFNIDYVDRNDLKHIKYCLAASKKIGFKPYVAEKDLHEVYTY